MLCFLSFMYGIILIAMLEAEMISFGQAIFFGIYIMIMFYHTSKPYWNEDLKN